MQILTGVLLSTLPTLSAGSPMKERAPTYAPAATATASSTSHASTPSIDLLSHTVSIADGLRGELKARAPSPQQTCANSGSGNSGCANSGISNSGTSNSGINNCGTGLSGVGDGCGSSSGVVSVASQTAVGAGAYTATLTGPTSTITVVLDAQHRRSDCAYWEAQGYKCAGAAGVRPGLGGALAAAVAVAVGGWVLVI